MNNKDKEIIEKLDKIWFTESGYQNEDLPMAYDSIKDLLLQVRREATIGMIPADMHEKVVDQVRREAIEECIKEARELEVGGGGGNKLYLDGMEYMRFKIIEKLTQLKNE